MAKSYDDMSDDELLALVSDMGAAATVVSDPSAPPEIRDMAAEGLGRTVDELAADD